MIPDRTSEFRHLTMKERKFKSHQTYPEHSTRYRFLFVSKYRQCSNDYYRRKRYVTIKINVFQNHEYGIGVYERISQRVTWKKFMDQDVNAYSQTKIYSIDLQRSLVGKTLMETRPLKTIGIGISVQMQRRRVVPPMLRHENAFPVTRK